ncbi:hypothetical protein LLG39_15855, partial [bacterium]|nr:hypothetical protein [bacterium]
QTRPKWSSFFRMLSYNQIPRRQYDRYDISKLEASALPASSLLALLPDLSADVGLAVWNILRLGSSGFNYTVKDSSGQDDEAGKEILDRVVDQINDRSGGLGCLIVQWLMSGFLQGAVAGEVALADGLSNVDDFCVVDPFTITFRRGEDGKLIAEHNPPGGGPRVALNPAKFWYIPIDPWIDDPYGRPPAAPVLQEVWFDIAVITDLRKVIHNQGWPRIDIKVVEEVLNANAPLGIKNDPTKMAEWLEARLAEVQAAYNALEPDDSFVHFDSVEIDQAAETGKLFDATAVMRVIERRMIKALKQLPILMASNEGTTETHGTVQWQIFVAGLKSLQDPIAFILERMMQLSLEVLGYQGRVECWFEPIRTTDRKADAEAEGLEISNAMRKWMLGWQTWEESAIEITGSAPPEGTTPPDPSMFAAAPASDARMLGAIDQIRTDPERARLYKEYQAWMDGE